MDTSTWKCQTCKQEGTGSIPEECPTCEYYMDDESLTQAGWKQTLRVQQLLDTRTRHIAKLLDYGDKSIDYTYADREGGSITVKWETCCGRGCCSPEKHDAEIPTRYLWLSDEEIQAEEKAKKEATEKKEAEKVRLKALAEAEQVAARARTKAATAEADARAALAKAEATLAALQGVQP